MKATARSSFGQTPSSHALSPVSRAWRVTAHSTIPDSFQYFWITVNPPSARWWESMYWMPERASSPQPK